MKREINTGHHQAEPFPIMPDFESETTKSLIEQAEVYGMRWLLAHADDGVTWGEFRSDGLHLSGDAFPAFSPPLRTKTLQQTRLFGPDAELLMWREDAAWRARLIQESSGEEGQYYDETHLLWGTAVEGQRDGFALLREGQEGFRHALPLAQEARLPACLLVRHYLAYDLDCQAYVAYSRLVAILNQGGEE